VIWEGCYVMEGCHGDYNQGKTESGTAKQLLNFSHQLREKSTTNQHHCDRGDVQYIKYIVVYRGDIQVTADLGSWE